MLDRAISGRGGLVRKKGGGEGVGDQGGEERNVEDRSFVATTTSPALMTTKRWTSRETSKDRARAGAFEGRAKGDPPLKLICDRFTNEIEKM